MQEVAVRRVQLDGVQAECGGALCRVNKRLAHAREVCGVHLPRRRL